MAYLIASAALHLWLSSRFYVHWAWSPAVIDGGPLGFLTWSIPTLVGTFACDFVLHSTDRGKTLAKLAIWSAVPCSPATPFPAAEENWPLPRSWIPGSRSPISGP